MLHLGLHYLQFASDVGLGHKHQARYAAWTAEAKNPEQPLAPRAENDFTHFTVISLNNDDEAAASKLDAKDCDVASER